MSGLTRTKLEERLEQQAKEEQVNPFLEANIGTDFQFTHPHYDDGDITRPTPEESQSYDPIVQEKDNLNGYLTVHYQNGDYNWFEFNFRVRDDVAYLSSVTRVDRPTDSGYQVLPEIKKSIHEYHPELTVTSDSPPWWE